MTISDQICAHRAEKMKVLWGGGFPEWDEYKLHKDKGFPIGIDKTFALKLLNTSFIPRKISFSFNGILGLCFFSSPIVALLWFFSEFSAWWILGVFLLSITIIKLTRETLTVTLSNLAYKDENVYKILVANGGMEFFPIGE